MIYAIKTARKYQQTQTTKDINVVYPTWGSTGAKNLEPDIAIYEGYDDIG